MNKRTTTRATLIASAVMTLLTTGIEAQAMPSRGMQVPSTISWFSDLLSLLGIPLRCSRCHDKED